MIVNNIVKQIDKQGGQAFFVGGYVRDEIVGINSKDIDIEVFNLPKKYLIEILSSYGKVDLVGNSFGVIKLTTTDNDFDFSLPRIETKKGKGHKGFDIVQCEKLSLKDAASRRDFTFNALMKNVKTGEVIDNFNGIHHINKKMIVHTSDKFSEDPLRVLRAMQFAGRFDFSIADNTANLCQKLSNEFDSIPKERIWMEFSKLFSKSIKPSRGIDILQKTGWIKFFPEIDKLNGVEQDPEWHPEGDVLMHTKHVMDEAARLSTDENRLLNVLAALCHDMGKITTTEFVDGRIRSRKHAIAGVEIAERFMERIKTPNATKLKVLELVREHMVHTNSVSKKTVRRLLLRMKYTSIDEMMGLIEADCSGRPPLKKGLPESAKLIKSIALEMGNEVKPILMGRHLVENGSKPGKHFGSILKQALDAQVNGEFEDLEGAITWLNELQVFQDIVYWQKRREV